MENWVRFLVCFLVRSGECHERKRQRLARRRRSQAPLHAERRAHPAASRRPPFESAVPGVFRRRSTTERDPPSHGDLPEPRSGPLSQQNIDFLRSRADQGQYLGMRHTTDAQTRTHNAVTNGLNRPGFYGDAYSLVPKTTEQAHLERIPQFARFANGPGFSGTDQAFNQAVMTGIDNSVRTDLSALDRPTVRQASTRIGGGTEFALANMGTAPGMRQSATYGASTPSFGKKRVTGDQVFREIGASPQQLLHGLQSEGIRPEQRIDSSQAFYKAADSMSRTFGRQINRGLDSMRTEAQNPHRERLAAAAERRMLQQQGRGRPAVQRDNAQHIDSLTQIIKAPSKTR